MVHELTQAFLQLITSVNTIFIYFYLFQALFTMFVYIMCFIHSFTLYIRISWLIFLHNFLSLFVKRANKETKPAFAFWNFMNKYSWLYCQILHWGFLAHRSACCTDNVIAFVTYADKCSVIFVSFLIILLNIFNMLQMDARKTWHCLWTGLSQVSRLNWIASFTLQLQSLAS